MMIPLRSILRFLVPPLFIISLFAFGVGPDAKADEKKAPLEFSVPVKLYSLKNEVDAAFITVKVFNKNNQLVAQGKTGIPFHHGPPADVNTTVVVKPESVMGRDPKTGFKYQAYLELSDGKSTLSPQKPGKYSGKQWIMGKPGAAFKRKVEGALKFEMPGKPISNLFPWKKGKEK